MDDNADCNKEKVFYTFAENVSPEDINQHLERQCMCKQGHEPFDQVKAMIDIFHLVGKLWVEEMQQPRHQDGWVFEVKMPSIWLEEV